MREGERYRFGNVTILDSLPGPPILDPGKLRARPGKAFDKEIVFRDRRAILNAYGDAGFLHSRSEETLTHDTVAKTIESGIHRDPWDPRWFSTA